MFPGAIQNPLKWAYPSVKEFCISRFPFQSHFSRVLQACELLDWGISKKPFQTPLSIYAGRQRLKGVFISQVLCCSLSHLGFPHMWLHIFHYVMYNSSACEGEWKALCWVPAQCTARRAREGTGLRKPSHHRRVWHCTGAMWQRSLGVLHHGVSSVWPLLD